MLNKEEIKKLKDAYPEGTPVRLFSMKGEGQMPSGLKGTVRTVDDIGQIHVLWENGRQLALNTEEDAFETVSPQEMEGTETAGEVNGMDRLI